MERRFALGARGAGPAGEEASWGGGRCPLRAGMMPHPSLLRGSGAGSQGAHLRPVQGRPLGRAGWAVAGLQHRRAWLWASAVIQRLLLRLRHTALAHNGAAAHACVTAAAAAGPVSYNPAGARTEGRPEPLCRPGGGGDLTQGACGTKPLRPSPNQCVLWKVAPGRLVSLQGWLGPGSLTVLRPGWGPGDASDYCWVTGSFSFDLTLRTTMTLTLKSSHSGT